MRGFALILCAFLLALGATASAELTPEQKKRAESLIAQFPAPEFATRQKAVEELVKMGPDVLPLVRKKLEETSDAEVRLRCAMVLEAPRRLAERVVPETKPVADPREAGTGGDAKLSPDGRHRYWLSQDRRGTSFVIDGIQGERRHGVFAPRVTGDWRKYVVFEYGREGGTLSLIEVEPPVPGERKLTETVRGTVPIKGHDVIVKRVFCEPRYGEAELMTSDHAPIEWGELPDLRKESGTIFLSPFDPIGVQFALAYRGHGNSLWAAIFRNRELGVYEALAARRGSERIAFSPDGRHVAYSGYRDHHWFAVRDGIEGPRWTCVEEVTLSPDGRHVAYTGGQDQRGPWSFCVDDRVGESYDDIKHITFSADSRHVAFIAQRDGRRFLVCDGAEGPAHARIAPRWSTPVGAEEKLRYSAYDPRDPSPASRGLASWELVEVDWPADLDWTHGLRPIAEKGDE